MAFRAGFRVVLRMDLRMVPRADIVNITEIVEVCLYYANALVVFANTLVVFEML